MQQQLPPWGVGLVLVVAVVAAAATVRAIPLLVLPATVRLLRGWMSTSGAIVVVVIAVPVVVVVTVAPPLLGGVAVPGELRRRHAPLEALVVAAENIELRGAAGRLVVCRVLALALRRVADAARLGAVGILLLTKCHAGVQAGQAVPLRPLLGRSFDGGEEGGFAFASALQEGVVLRAAAAAGGAVIEPNHRGSQATVSWATQR